MLAGAETVIVADAAFVLSSVLRAVTMHVAGPVGAVKVVGFACVTLPQVVDHDTPPLLTDAERAPVPPLAMVALAGDMLIVTEPAVAPEITSNAAITHELVPAGETASV
jgi:hypothetical protein